MILPKERSWRLVMDGQLPAAENMARDEAIMLEHSRAAVPPTVRFYGWSPPGLSIGYFQRLQSQVDLDACARLGVDVVRRPTGGRAVLHHREVTYSVIVAATLLPGSVEDTYLSISTGLLAGLRQLGIEAVMVPPGRAAASSAACFDAPSSYEIALDGRKLVGSAQVRSGGVILQHGSVLLEFDAAMVASLLRFASPQVRERAARLLESRAVGLNQVSTARFGFGEVAEALAAGLSGCWQLEFEACGVTEQEEALAAALVESKYGSSNWNMKR